MKSETTLRERPEFPETYATWGAVRQAYDQGADDLMSCLADEFGLETNGYGGAAGREALVEHIRKKLAAD